MTGPTNSDLHELLKMMAQRAGVRVAHLTVSFSDDPRYFSRRRLLLFTQVVSMLDSIGCNLADLSYELGLRPTLQDWEIIGQLDKSLRQSPGKQNHRLKSLSPFLDRLRVDQPKRVVQFLERILSYLAGDAVIEATLVLGPALRATGQSGKAIAILKWVVASKLASRCQRALALQRLAYAQASNGRMCLALRSALAAQDLHRLEGTLAKVAEGEVDKAIFRYELGHLDDAYQGYQRALLGNYIDKRNLAAALNGLALVAIKKGDRKSATEAVSQLAQYEEGLQTVDIGKICWTKGRLFLVTGDHEAAKHELLKASALLAEHKAEDSFFVLIEMLIHLEGHWDFTSNARRESPPVSFGTMVYSRAHTSREIRFADEVVRSYGEGSLTCSRLRQIRRQLRPGSAAFSVIDKCNLNDSDIYRWFKSIARRAGVRVAHLTKSFSNDPRLFSRRRRLRFTQVGAMLESVGCNLADLTYDLRLEPTLESWPITRKLRESFCNPYGRQNHRFGRLLPALREFHIVSLPRLASFIERVLPWLSGNMVLEAALLLGPALRAAKRPGKAIAILTWVANSKPASRAQRALALQRLGYAQASYGRKQEALYSAQIAQDLNRLEGDVEKVAEGEVDKAIFRYELGNFEDAYLGYLRALECDTLNRRNQAAALNGLALIGMEFGDTRTTADIVALLHKFEEQLDEPVDIGKIQWSRGRLLLLMGDRDTGTQELLKASDLLARNGSEDAFRVLVDMLTHLHGHWNFTPQFFRAMAYTRAQTTQDLEFADEITRTFLMGSLTLARLHRIQEELGPPFQQTELAAPPP